MTAAKIANDVRPIIVKKVVEAGHAAHHGGAWKIAYADFVTAMMAFFLLMWLLGMTDEEKRKGLADYFAPTLVEMRQGSAGSNGLLGGDSIVSADNYPHRAGQTGSRSITIPRDATGGASEAARRAAEETARLESIERAVTQRLRTDPSLRELVNQVRLMQTDDGLQIDLMEGADFAMFGSGTDQLLPRAQRLVAAVARSVATAPNRIIIRGHTDALPFRPGQAMNNWLLSSARADSTRAALAAAGVRDNRFSRIEGVADGQPLFRDNPADPRNRRIAITLERQYRRPAALPANTVPDIRPNLAHNAVPAGHAGERITPH
ncbi:MAG: flagellar motor protein MotB [Sphingopyxis sp.]